MRNANVHTWIVLDGPIEPLWVENLNTVLDDTKILTLANGDRTPMEPDSRLLFEVDALHSVSPATITRTGVVTFSADLVPVKSVVDSWLAGRRSEEGDLLSVYLEKLVVPVIEFITK